MDLGGISSRAMPVMFVTIWLAMGCARAHADQPVLTGATNLESQELVVESIGQHDQPSLLQLAQAPVASDSGEGEISNASVSDTGASERQSSTGVGATSEESATSQLEDEEETWLDSGHGYVTEKADDLTRWFDSYFGSTEADQNVASSRLRLRVTMEEDEREGTNFRVSVGGKVNLPQISKRLDLVFRGDDPADDINGQ